MSNKGAIASGHLETTSAASAILQAGGNAFDAAIAALFASFVAEPCMSSPAAGGFMTAKPVSGKPFLLDFFCQTPMRKRPMEEIDFFPVTLDFGTVQEDFHVGLGAVAVPGVMKAIFHLHSHYGSVPLTRLAEPAVDLARHGIKVSPYQYHDFILLKPILDLSPDSPYWHEGSFIEEGEIMFLKELADFMDVVTKEGEDLFYRGEVMQELLKLQDRRGGGMLTKEDFSAYKIQARSPLQVPYRNKSLLTNPLPSMGGSLIAIALAMLAKKGKVEYPHGSAIHTERLKHVFADLENIPRNTEGLHGALQKFYPGQQLPLPESPGGKKIGGTTHISIMDKAGNAVSVSVSIGEGAGFFVPGTGINLNNMLGESALFPKGLHTWKENERLSSMMSPSIVLDGNSEAEIVLGSGGAGRIPGQIMQVIHALVDHALPVAEAVNAPRMHWLDGECNLEPGLEPSKNPPKSLRHRIDWEDQSMFFGGVHTVCKKKGELFAEADQRRDGVSKVL